MASSIMRGLPVRNLKPNLVGNYLINHHQGRLGSTTAAALLKPSKPHRDYSTSTTDAVSDHGDHGRDRDYYKYYNILKLKGGFAPVYISLGLILLSSSLGLYTVYRFLSCSPNVSLMKGRREKLMEVEEPEKVTDEAEKFVKNSFFRRLAHVQQFETTVPSGPGNYGESAVDKPSHVEAFKTEAKRPETNPA